MIVIFIFVFSSVPASSFVVLLYQPLFPFGLVGSIFISGFVSESFTLNTCTHAFFVFPVFGGYFYFVPACSIVFYVELFFYFVFWSCFFCFYCFVLVD